jgi:cytochrome b subunit of formate dehydrogenase
MMSDLLLEKNISQKAPKEERFLRFDIFQRFEHLVFLLSFGMLGLTGLIQKFATSPVAEFILKVLGGIETTRIIHRSASIAMMLVTAFHIIGILYRIFVKRVTFDMIPSLEDFRHLFQDILFYLGRRKKKAAYGRYSYAEKVEYFAVVWGTIIMGVTGFMMWNPIAAARFLPGEYIPAAKAAHGGEAILAVLAIILWHFYHVHFRHFNKSMFTGVLTREEMEHEHPSELVRIDARMEPTPLSEKAIQKRQRIFIPGAILISALFGFGIIQFITLEETAIQTIPPGETAQVFVPLTPTPEPTLAPSPTPAEMFAITWDGGLEGLFRNRCSTCHGFTSVGGLSLATYEQAIQGGDSGPAVVPGDPDAGTLLEVQSTGNHPGQLSDEELEQVIEWILAGAPEK